MGNFLIILPRPTDSALCRPLFENALADACKLGAREPSQTEELSGARAATFPRRNGTSSRIAVDRKTGDWLLASGTWFHPSEPADEREQFLLQRYQVAGVERVAQELEGFYVLFIGDARCGTTYAITDLAGSCHAFWRQLPGTMLLSGSSLLLASLAPTKTDPLAWQEFLSLGVIYEDRTLFREVRKLRPASIYRFEKGQLASVETYWSVGKLELESRGGKEAAMALWEGLRLAARRVAERFPNAVCDLTGGYDSRALVAAFLSGGFRPCTAVSGPPESGDVRVSRELAKAAGLRHRYVQPEIVWSGATLRDALSVTDGEYDLVEYAHILTIHSVLSREFEASCNGSFGEVARGFWWEVLWPHTGERRPLDAQKIAASRYATQKYDLALIAPTERVDIVAHMAEVVRRTAGEESGLTNTSLMDQVYLWMRMQRWQGRIASSTNRVWPCLSPFLLRPVLEAMLETKAQFRRRSLIIRTMLAECYPQWARIPLEHGYPAQPASWKNLHRFLPLGNYYGRKIVMKGLRMAGISPGAQPRDATTSAREHLLGQEEVCSLLELRRIQETKLFAAGAIARVIEQLHAHDGPVDERWSRLLTLECTLRALERSR